MSVCSADEWNKMVFIKINELTKKQTKTSGQCNLPVWVCWSLMSHSKLSHFGNLPHALTNVAPSGKWTEKAVNFLPLQCPRWPLLPGTLICSAASAGHRCVTDWHTHHATGSSIAIGCTNVPKLKNEGNISWKRQILFNLINAYYVASLLPSLTYIVCTAAGFGDISCTIFMSPSILNLLTFFWHLK